MLNLFQIFGSLIQRKLIALELSDRMPTLVSMLNQEMDESKIIYQKQMNRSVMISITRLFLILPPRAIPTKAIPPKLCTVVPCERTNPPRLFLYLVNTALFQKKERMSIFLNKQVSPKNFYYVFFVNS